MDQQISYKKPFFDKKTRREMKRKKRSDPDMVLKLLHKWEMIRPQAVNQAERSTYIDEILNISKNKMVDLCLAHDTVRVFQSVIKHGSKSQRNVVFRSLLEGVPLLVGSIYGQHIIRKFFKYGDNTIRSSIFLKILPLVPKLIKRKISAHLLDIIYNEFANKNQRNQMFRSLLGGSFIILPDNSEIGNLDQAIKAFPEKKMSILLRLTKIILTIIYKDLHQHTFSQHLLQQLTATLSSPGFDTPEQQATQQDMIKDLVEASHPRLLPLVYTKPGVKAAVRLLGWCSQDQLLHVLPSLTNYGASLALHPFGHVALLAVLLRLPSSPSSTQAAHSHTPQVYSQHSVGEELVTALDSLIQAPVGRAFLLAVFSRLTTLAGDQRSTLAPLLTNQSSVDSVRSRLAGPLLLRLADCAPGLLAVNATVYFVQELVLHLPDQCLYSGQARVAQCRLFSAVCQLLGEEFRPLEPGSELACRLQQLARLKRQLVDDSGEASSKAQLRRKRARLLKGVNVGAGGPSNLKPTFRLLPLRSNEEELEELRERNVEKVKEEEKHDLDGGLHFIERAAGSIFLHKLLKRDQQRLLDSTTSSKEKAKQVHLVACILEAVPLEVMATWLQSNRGCFVLVHMIETKHPDTARLFSFLSAKRAEIVASGFKGGEILLKYLS